MKSHHDHNKRRALIARRWTAYRVGRAQREIWRKRREAQGDAQGRDPDEVVGEDDLLAELPESLLG